MICKAFINGLGNFENFNQIPAEKSIVVIENEKVRIELNLDSMYGDMKNGVAEIKSFRAKAFVKFKTK